VSDVPSATRPRDLLDPDALVALEEERDFLLRSLEDLEREHAAGDVDDRDHETLRDDYTARAAAVIRAIDQRRERMAAAKPRRSPARLVAWVAVVVVVAAGAGWLVAGASGSRGPGETVSGDIRASSIDEIAQANRLTAEASALAAEGQGDEAIDAYQRAIAAYGRALELQPANVEAMTYRGWLLHTIALQAPADSAAELDAAALEWLDRAIATDAAYADARVFRAIMLARSDPATALADLDAVPTEAVPPGMRSLVDGLRAEVAAAAGEPQADDQGQAETQPQAESSAEGGS
jgi:tetratricopeptide (TPR) repeat protein